MRNFASAKQNKFVIAHINGTHISSVPYYI